MPHRPEPRALSLRPLLLGLAALAGCSSPGAFVWARDASDADFTVRRTGEYVIEAGDVLAVRVVGQDGLATRGRVRADGRISLPLVGDVEAESRTPLRLAKELEIRLKPFMVAPSVSVSVEESLPVQISVVGEVAHPGIYSVTPDAGVLWAIAGAGGPTEYASRDRIFVVRASQGRTSRLRFTYDRLTRGVLPDALFALRPGDAVVVE